MSLDEDLEDEEEEEVGDGHDIDLCDSRACQQGAVGDIDEDMDEDDVSALWGYFLRVVNEGCLLQAAHPPLVCWLNHLFSQETKRHVLKVRLDIFHALQRISRLVKKSHGAHRTFMSRLRDACFVVNKDDIREVRVVGVLDVVRRDRNTEAVIISWFRTGM